MKIRGITTALASVCAFLLFAQCAPLRDSTSTGGGNRSFRFPTTGVAVEKQAMLLAIDELLLPLRENVSYYLSKPDVIADLDGNGRPDLAAVAEHGSNEFRWWRNDGKR